MTSLSDKLVESLGRDALLPQEQLTDYAVDGLVPEMVVFPRDVGAVSQALSIASGQEKRVVPWGGGTQMALGNVPGGVDLALGLRRLDRILFHEPGDLVVGVEAGATLKSLQDELAKQGQLLPLMAPIPSRATIGGVLAANAGGPLRLGYGAARDWLIGIKVVHSDGAVAKAGGKVVKNVAGYDLNKLYTGSLGTLGVIVEANFKLVPLPPERRTIVAAYSSLSAALDAAQGLLQQTSIPQALQVINRGIIDRLPGLNIAGDGEAALLSLFAGRRSSVKRKVDDSTGLLKGGAMSIDDLAQNDGDGLWQAITDMGWEGERPPLLMARAISMPSQVADVLAMVDSLSSGQGVMPPGIMADVGVGLVRLVWWTEENMPDTRSTLDDLVKGLRDGMRGYAGHLVVERCPVELKRSIDVWGDSMEGMDIMRRIKQELDPAGILNPGRFAGRI
jgi:glycolate oxidase FAD binding subunit